jgi:hypothetical protein
MKITVKLPFDRTKAGRISLDDGRSWRCRGKADNQKATEHGNPNRDPCAPWGDHPSGIGRISGDMKTRDDAEPGWDGLEAHGGDPQADGVSLRATYGCLRLDNSTVVLLANECRAALARGEEIEYVVVNV